MCGISGCWLTSEFVDVKKLKKSNLKMVHRGPDGYDTWISEDGKIGFSHVRLSIVDLDVRSSQPFKIDDGNLVIVFNGEIYNYLDLKNKYLSKFNIIYKTTSDTEVLLYMYKFYGKKCLEYLDGMFSFVIYDKKKDILFIARDFVGQKPLVYNLDSRGFYFSSEIPSLFELNKSLSKEIDFDSMDLFLLDKFSHIPAPFTIFKNIQKLEPGTYIVIKNNKIVEKVLYAKLFKSKNYDISEEFLSTQISKMVPCDVNYASFLSGGIDSSLICKHLVSNNENLMTYTLKISYKDEDYIRSKYVSETLNLKQKYVSIGKNLNTLKTIDDFVSILGEPYYQRSSIYADKILQEVDKKYKVMFSGAGGDEIYYGYNNKYFLLLDLLFYLKKKIPFLKFLFSRKLDFLFKSNMDNFKYNYFKSDLKNKSILLDIHKSNNYLKIIIKNFKRQVSYSSYLEFSYTFGLFVENSHSLTIQGDLVGMKNSVEIRSPFLEKNIIMNAYSIPLRKKILFLNLTEGKKILRNYLKKTLSRKFIFSKKLGFGVKTDLSSKISQNDINVINLKLTSLLNRGYFDKSTINIILNNFNSNYDLILKLYSLEIWFEKFID